MTAAADLPALRRRLLDMRSELVDQLGAGIDGGTLAAIGAVESVMGDPGCGRARPGAGARARARARRLSAGAGPAKWTCERVK